MPATGNSQGTGMFRSSPVGFHNRINRIVDRVAGLDKGFSPDQKEKARALVLWSFLACPILPFLVHIDRQVAAHVLLESHLLSGLWCFASCIAAIRFTKSVSLTGVWFGSWTLITIAIGPLMLGEPTSITLSLLVLAPIIFGLTAGSRACILSTFGVMLILTGVYASAVLQHGVVSRQSWELLIVYLASTAFCGISVSYFTRLNEKERRVLGKANADIKAVALTDALTQIRNRRAFQYRLDRLSGVDATDKRIALMIFDLDGFKQVNDTYGHDAGDEVLQEVATRLRPLMTSRSTLYRLGGDEFGIYCVDPESRTEVMDLAASIIERIDAPMQTCGGEVSVRVSIGLAFSDGTSWGLQQLYRRADTAAFVAKEKQGSSLVVFSKVLDGKLSRETAIQEGLKTAISRSNLDVAFQPQVDLATRRIKGFEALARWTDTQLGSVSPYEFIGIAERSSLVQAIDRQIIIKTLRHAEGFLSPTQRISVNVSGRSMIAPDFADFLLRQIGRVRIRPDQVEVEITESALIRNWEASKRNLNALREAGVRLVLDGFGVGYSSLSYLAQFPVQKLKFDKSFLVQSATPANILVMQSIIQLADSMHLDVVAEGVEGAAHVSVLRRLQCGEGQGYFLSKPMSVEQIRSLVGRTDSAPNPPTLRHFG